MAFQYPASKYQYLRDVGKGTPFTIVHKAVQKAVGLNTAVLVAELEWGFSRYEHSTAKDAHFGMPRYITTPAKRLQFVPVLGDKCNYTSARAFKAQFEAVGTYYGTLTEYTEQVESGEDPFHKKPYLCVYNRKKHYARFLRNPKYANRFFIDCFNQSYSAKALGGSPLFSKLEASDSKAEGEEKQFVHEMPLSSSSYISSTQSNTVNTSNTVDKVVSNITVDEVFTSNSVVGDVNSQKASKAVGQVKSKPLPEPDIRDMTNGCSIFESNCTEEFMAIVERKAAPRPSKSADKQALLTAVGDAIFKSATPAPELDLSAYSFSSVKKTTALTPQTIYRAWEAATLTHHPKTCLKPPTLAALGMCKHIINGAKPHFADSDIAPMITATLQGWSTGELQAILGENTTQFTFPAQLEIPYLLKNLTHFMTWYKAKLEKDTAKKLKVSKPVGTNSLQTALSGVQSTKAAPKVEPKATVAKDVLVSVKNTAGFTYSKGVTATMSLSGYKQTIEFKLAKAEYGNLPSGVLEQIKSLLAKQSVDFEASLAKVSEYKLTHTASF